MKVSVKNKAGVKEGTEEKIKSAARELFLKHGFNGVKTRDIAETAGINLALLNYYFRSKEKLFEIILLEKMQNFMKIILQEINDEKSSMEDKLERICNHYFSILSSQPELPIFVLHHFYSNPDSPILESMKKNRINESVLFKQIHKHRINKKLNEINPFHFFINLMSLTIFPFAASPILKNMSGLSNKKLEALIAERKSYILLWMRNILNS